LTGDGDDQGSVGVALLGDIRAAFAVKVTDRLSSEELVAYLISLEDRLWPEYRAAKPITKTQVARLLRPLHVSSGTIRVADGRTAKGYNMRAFADAFARYLPPENVTPSQPQDFRAAAPDSETSQGSRCDVFVSAENPSISAPCDGVTDREALANDGEFQERAAIREFDGGYPRAEAERLAFAGLAGRRKKSWLQ